MNWPYQQCCPPIGSSLYCPGQYVAASDLPNPRKRTPHPSPHLQLSPGWALWTDPTKHCDLPSLHTPVPHVAHSDRTSLRVHTSGSVLHTSILPPGAIVHISAQLYNDHSSYPHLEWDIAQMPSLARRCRLEGVHAAPKFSKPAVTPPQSELLIHSTQRGLSVYLNCWGPIRAARLDGEPITVENVMNAIFDYFQIQLAPHQVSTPKEWEQVLMQWKERARRSPNLYSPQFEISRGPCRIDLLSAFCGTLFGGVKLYPEGGPGGRDALYLTLRSKQ